MYLLVINSELSLLLLFPSLPELRNRSLIMSLNLEEGT
jgi:hypothetical protein